MISMGGPMALIPDIHRYLVLENNWISDAMFTDSIVIAQAAPGPNVLFLALLGWNMGFQVGGYLSAVFAALGCLLSYLIPTSIFYYLAANWVERNRFDLRIRAFKAGMGPIVVALLIASGVVVAISTSDSGFHWKLWLLVGLTVTLVVCKKLPMLLLLLAGAAVGALGLLN